MLLAGLHGLVSHLDQGDVVEIDDRLVPAGPENDRDPVAWLMLDLLRRPDENLGVVREHEAEGLERLAQEQSGEGGAVTAGGRLVVAAGLCGELAGVACAVGTAARVAAPAAPLPP